MGSSNTPIQTEVIQSIKEHGYWVGNVSQLWGTKSIKLLERCDILLKPLKEELKKSRLNNLVGNAGLISRENENRIIYQAGLEQSILEIAHQILGIEPGYDGAELRISKAAPEGEKRDNSGTKTRHFDIEEGGQGHSTLKIIVYLNDVGINNGPFTFINEDGSEKPITGEKETVIFANTGKYEHYGAPLINGIRETLQLSIHTNSPYAEFCVIYLHSLRLVRRMTIGLTDYQKRVASWRRRFPYLFIPVMYHIPFTNFRPGSWTNRKR
ncbi:MAG: hypothetical protein QNJ31_01610 [Candidatus Caenarcaniphilales bacterium]|nr:hypothetical protein [Candidatus Caenarcaniphilales bacterium]